MRFLACCLFLVSLIPALSQPELAAKSALVMDAETGIVVFEKEGYSQRYPASTTKILTALLLLENCDLNDKISAPLDVQEVTGSSLYLEPGERITAEDALYALMIRSANDVAYAVACHIGGSVEKFSTMMNKRAEDIGCRDTIFRNPHGLHDPEHVSSAHDIALIAREAMKNEKFRKAASTITRPIRRSINQDDLLLISRNRLLRDDLSYDGIKTGYTNPAGRCFVGSKTVDGWRLITVVLGSQDWIADTIALNDWAFASFERRPLLLAGAPVGDAPVRNGKPRTVPGRLERDLHIVTARDGLEREPEMEWQELIAPIAESDVIGFAKAIGVDGQLVAVPILAAHAVDVLPPIFSPKRGLPFWTLLFGLVGTGFMGARWLRARNA